MKEALRKGDLFTKLSFLFCGAGNLARGQVIKGLLFLLVECSYLLYMLLAGVRHLSLLPSLGWLTQGEVYNETKGIYEYTAGHNSVLILLWGLITVFLTVLFVVFWKNCIKSAYKAQQSREKGKPLNS